MRRPALRFGWKDEGDMATITGTEGDDSWGTELLGTPGDDLYLGLGGNDWLIPSAGDDTLDGGPGSDVAIYEAGGVSVNGVFINNTDADIDGVAARTVDKRGFGTDTLIGVENFHGTAADDVIHVGASETGSYSFDRSGDDLVVANQDPAAAFGHYFFAGLGDDTLVGSAANWDSLDYRDDVGTQVQGLVLAMSGGGNGTATDPWGDADTFFGIEQVQGSNRADAITMDDNDRNAVTGGAGDDTLDGGAGTRDRLDYGREMFLGGIQGVTVDLATGTATDSFGHTDSIAGFEDVGGTTFDDTLRGDDQDNWLDGGEGDDLLEGGAGEDGLTGGDGDDTLNGGEGGDYIRPGAGNDEIDGGANGPDWRTDEITYYDDAATTGVTVTFTDETSGTAVDWAGDTDTFTGIERVTGTRFDDVIIAAGGDQQLRGEDGDDLLGGGEGNDGLQGGAGDDTLDGGEGRDVANYDAERFLNGVFINNTDADIDGVAARTVDKRGFGTDTLIGVESFHGTDADDVIHVGGTGNSYTFDGAGNDVVVASQTPDIEDGHDFIAGSGNDTYVGSSADNDTLEYSSTDEPQSGALTLIMTGDGNGTATDPWGDTDTFSGIERVRGTVGADTIIMDDDDRNDVTGGAGDDTLDGGAGTRDRLRYDQESWMGSVQGVTVDLADGTATDSFGDADSIAGFEQVWGTNFDDTLQGDDGDNWLEGRGGDDLLEGRDGDDGFLAGAGDDTILGGDGFDEAVYDDQVTTGIDADLAANTVADGSGGTDTLDSIEAIRGSEFDDTIRGDDQNNSLEGDAGDDLLEGRAGEDDLRGGAGDDTLNGGDDQDRLRPGAGIDLIDGGANGLEWRTDELIYDDDEATTGVTVTFTDETSGTAVDWAGDTDTFTGIERVRGTRFDDVLIAGAGDQELGGEDGNDSLVGGGGEDQLRGGAGDDTLIGGDDQDQLRPGAGTDVIDGGANGPDGRTDELVYDDDEATTGVTVTFTDETSGTAIDWAGDTDTFTGIERVRGTWFDDVLIATVGEQQLSGEDGNDSLVGGEGDDDLNGGDGDDTLIGGEGGDFLQPGAGTDVVEGGENGVTGGDDELSYQYDDAATTGITVTFTDATSGSVLDWSGSTDTFTGIERVRGTHFADVLIGSEGRQVFRPNGGDDFIDGGDGDEDRIDYRDTGGGDGIPHGPVNVNMETGTASDGFGFTDTFINIEQIRGSDFDDTILGDDNDNHISGEGGDDIIDGGLGENDLQGGDGNDTITSLSSRDWIDAGSGNDTIIITQGDEDDRPGVDPGLGSDTIIQQNGAIISLHYGSLDHAVTIDLALGTTQKPFGDTDTFGVVENVEGGRGDDTIYGSDAEYESFNASFGHDVIDGRGGFDELRFTDEAETGVTVDTGAGTATGSFLTATFTNIESIQGSRGADSVTGSAAEYEQFRMLAGDDTIDGGDGIDRVDYTSDRYFDGLAGVTVNLELGLAVDGFGDTDTLLNIEQARGSIFDDELIGDALENRLIGDDGNDTLRGGGGIDVLVGGEGDDSLFGGADRDYLNGGAGVDRLQGDAGPDVFRGTLQDLGGDTIVDYEAGDSIWVVGDDGGNGAPSIGADITTDGAFIYIDTDGDGTAEAVMINGNGYVGPVASHAGPAGSTGPLAAVVSLVGAGAVMAQAQEGDGGSTGVQVTLRRAGDLNATVTVDFEIAGFGATPATADDLADGFGPGSVTFAPNQTEATVLLQVAGDTAIEPDELLRVTLTGVAGDGPVAAQLSGTEGYIRLLNDDARPAISISSGRFSESEEELRFTVTREGPDFGQEVSVSYLLLADPGPRGAQADDVVGGLPQSGTVAFAAGQAAATITLRVVDDSVSEFHERIVAQLTGIGGPGALAYQLGAGNAVGEIGNDDSGVPPVFPGSGFSASVFLDPHLVTRDGLGYEFQAVGEFTFVESSVGMPLLVQVRFSPVPGSDIASQTTAVATLLGSVRVMIDVTSPQTILFDGVATDLSALTGGMDVGDGQVFYDGEAVTVVYATGEQMRVDMFPAFLNVALALDPARPTRGLLGDGDGDTANDLALPDGTVTAQPISHADLFGTFAAAWRITDAASLFDYPPGTGTADFTDTGFPRAVLDLAEVPEVLLAQAEALAAGIANPALRDAAVRDFLMSGNADYFAAAETVQAVPLVELAPLDQPLPVSGAGVSASDVSILEGDGAVSTILFTIWRSGDVSGLLSLSYAISSTAGAVTQGSATFAVGEATVAVVHEVTGDRLPGADELIVFELSDLPDGLLRYSGRATTSVIDDDHGPVALNDQAMVDEDGSVRVDVLANDQDADGDMLTVVALTQGTSGEVIINADGTVSYTPHADFHGTDAFSYTVSDGFGSSASATVQVQVMPVNDAPMAVGDSNSVKGSAISGPATLLENDMDVDGDLLTVTGFTAAANGTVVVDADGSFTYAANAGFSGTDSFTYTVTDPAGSSSSATVLLNVEADEIVFNAIHAARGQPFLRGTAEADALIFNETRSTQAFGGDGADVFVFLRGDSGKRDVGYIRDFQQGVDLIDVGDAGYSLMVVGSSTVVRLAGPDRDALTVSGAVLTSDDFTTIWSDQPGGLLS
jgi:Ca2+-binding RTX toxin-like protein